MRADEVGDIDGLTEKLVVFDSWLSIISHQNPWIFDSWMLVAFSVEFELFP